MVPVSVVTVLGAAGAGTAGTVGAGPDTLGERLTAPVEQHIVAAADGTSRDAGDPGARSVGTVSEAIASLASDIVVVHDAGARLVPEAIDAMCDAVTRRADVAHADWEITTADGSAVRAYPPTHSPVRLRHQDCIGPVLVMRREALMAAGGWHAGFAGAEIHELALRLTETGARFERFDRVAARVVDGDGDDSTASSTRRAIEAHLARSGIDADVRPGPVPGTFHVARRLADAPLVSVVIPTRGSSGEVFGGERCFVVEAVRSLVERSTYRELEFVVVHDRETPAVVLDELVEIAGDALVLEPFDAPFNFPAKIGAGVRRAHGELLLLLNDDTQLIEPSSVGELVGHLQDPGVALVGAKLLFEDGRLQHGGHVYNRSIHHACFGWPGTSPGPAPLHPLAVARECSGVTAGCALVRRAAYDEVGGLDPELPHNYNDVDFSLKLRAAGHRIVWTPWATWFHFESRTRVPDIRPEELAFVERRWSAALAADPYYHPALPRDRADWQPEPAPEPEPSASLARRMVRQVRSLLPRRRFRRPHGVNLVGYLGATSGLGDRVRELEALLRIAGVRYSRWDVDLTESSRPVGQTSPNPDDGTIFDTTIAVVTALAFPGLEGAYGPLVHEVDRVIGYWFWELDHIPESHRPAIAMVDEIWTPTRFVHDAYASATDMPVEVVRLPIVEPTPSSLDRTDVGFGEEFVFVCSFDHLSSMERKYPHGAIDAFRRAFPDADERVRLVVKSINGHLRPDASARLAAATGGDDRIDLRDGYIDHADQAALLAAADAYVSLHRSEGLGLHIAEAMWLGTPVVATDYSGSTDLTTSDGDGDVAELVDATLVPVAGGGEAYQAGTWAQPDLDQAAAAMRRLVHDEARRAELAANARRWMRRVNDRERAARELARRLRHGADDPRAAPLDG